MVPKNRWFYFKLPSMCEYPFNNLWYFFLLSDNKLCYKKLSQAGCIVSEETNKYCSVWYEKRNFYKPISSWVSKLINTVVFGMRKSDQLTDGQYFSHDIVCDIS